MATRSSSRPLGDRFYQLSTGRGELWQSLRIDPPLVLSLFCLAAYGLLVLFSASGENVADVQRQTTVNALQALPRLQGLQATLG